MRNAGLDEAQAGIKTAGRNINNLRSADGTALMAESREGLKSRPPPAQPYGEITAFKMFFWSLAYTVCMIVLCEELLAGRVGNSLISPY